MIKIGSRVMILKDAQYATYYIKAGDIGTIKNTHKNVFNKPVYSVAVEPYDVLCLFLENKITEI